jgi:hypothetical protein
MRPSFGDRLATMYWIRTYDSLHQHYNVNELSVSETGRGVSGIGRGVSGIGRGVSGIGRGVSGIGRGVSGIEVLVHFAAFLCHS